MKDRGGSAGTQPGRWLRIAVRAGLPVVLGSVLFLSLGRFASAQQPEIDALAAKLGKALSEAHAQSLVIFDFAGPGKGVTQMGLSWTSQFSTALAKPENGFTVLSQSGLALEIQKENLATDQPWDKASLSLARGIAGKAGATALVIGAITENSDGFRLTVDSYQVSEDKRIDGFGVSIPRSEALEKLLAKSQPASGPSIPTAGKDGYSVPQCAYCPSPLFNSKVVSEKMSGTVVLRVFITAGGRAKNIRVVSSTDDRLKQEAIDAVWSWRFRPAKDPTGRPAPVESLVEVKFKLQ